MARLLVTFGLLAQLIQVQVRQLNGDTRLLKDLKLGGIGLGWIEHTLDIAALLKLLKLPLWGAVLIPLGSALNPSKLSALKADLKTSDKPMLTLGGKILYGVLGRTPGELDPIPDANDDSKADADQAE